jgi:hypothetical protein
LLELIWPRLGNEFNAQFRVDDNLVKEVIAPLLAGEVVIDGSTRGWMFHYSTLSKKQLARLKEKKVTNGPSLPVANLLGLRHRKLIGLSRKICDLVA